MATHVLVRCKEGQVQVVPLSKVHSSSLHLLQCEVDNEPEIVVELAAGIPSYVSLLYSGSK